MNETTLTYQNPKGAEAYWEKEKKTAEARNADVEVLLDKIDLQGRVVIDMGCGFGRDVAAMRKRGAIAYGLDVSPSLLEKARALEGEGFAEADIFTLQVLPFNLSKVDVIWAYSLLLHIPPEALPEIITQWAGWLSPKGCLVLTSKYGQGEKLQYNLGSELPRKMFFYKPEDIMTLLPAFKVQHEVVRNVRQPAEDYFELILEKPE